MYLALTPSRLIILLGFRRPKPAFLDPKTTNCEGDEQHEGSVVISFELLMGCTRATFYRPIASARPISVRARNTIVSCKVMCAQAGHDDEPELTELKTAVSGWSSFQSRREQWLHLQDDTWGRLRPSLMAAFCEKRPTAAAALTVFSTCVVKMRT
ncbi:hypothetical protein FI667_g3821, partial [Globisporangium splendens]